MHLVYKQLWIFYKIVYDYKRDFNNVFIKSLKVFGGLFAKNVVNSAEFAEKEAPAVLLFKRYQI